MAKKIQILTNRIYDFRLLCTKDNRYSAFTLIEVLIVVGLIALLAAITIVAINPAKDFETIKVSKAKFDINTLHKGVEQYLIDNGDYPSTIPVYYKEICKDGVDQSTCESNGKVFLGELAGEYMAELPISPNVTENSYGIGYEIRKNQTDGKVSVVASSVVPDDYIININEYNIIEVGTGTDYATITSAMNSISDNSPDNYYILRVRPGTYNESVNIKSYVEVWGSGIDETIIGNNVYLSSYTHIRNCTVSFSGNQAWKAGLDAHSRVANPAYASNVKVVIDTNTGPIYPILTRTGSYIESHGVTVVASQPPNGGDGLCAICHNSGSQRFYDGEITLTVKPGSGTRDDLYVIGTQWTSDTRIYDSNITLVNNATSNNQPDRIVRFVSSPTRIEFNNTQITYASDNKSFFAFQPSNSGTIVRFINSDLSARLDGVGTYANGPYTSSPFTMSDSSISISKTGTGDSYGLRLVRSDASITNSTVAVSNLSAGSTNRALLVEGVSPVITASTFNSTGGGVGSIYYGGYITNPTCNPIISSSSLSGETEGLVVNTGCAPVLTNNTYSSLVYY